MAGTGRNLLLVLLMMFSVCCSSSILETREGRGRKVGGRMEIEDVKKNKEIQDLGKFSVEEFNHRNLINGGGLTFYQVVEAQRQVVSGLKYYLKISAFTEQGEIEKKKKKTFDAIVVVKPWVQSKKLLDFAPSSSRTVSE